MRDIDNYLIMEIRTTFVNFKDRICFFLKISGGISIEIRKKFDSLKLFLLICDKNVCSLYQEKYWNWYSVKTVSSSLCLIFGNVINSPIKRNKILLLI